MAPQRSALQAPRRARATRRRRSRRNPSHEQHEQQRRREAADRHRSASRPCCRIAIRSCWSIACSRSSRQAHRRAQERHRQRAVLPGPLPGPPGDAGRADHRSDGAGRRHAASSCRRRRSGSSTGVFYLVKVDNARFNRVVVPGDQLRLEVELKRAMRNMSLFKCQRAASTAKSRAEAELLCAEVAQLMIHATALVDPAARIGADVSDRRLQRHRRRRRDRRRHDDRPARRRSKARRASAATTASSSSPRSAAIPQDKKYARRAQRARHRRSQHASASSSRINRGTGDGGGATRIGDDNWIMAYVHIAHDCNVGNHTVFANNATLAGHVDDRRLRDPRRLRRHPPVLPIGAHAFIGMGSLVNGDVPPFVMVAGRLRPSRAASTPKD